MSFDAMLVSAGVAAIFIVFAAVLLWGDYQTRPDRLNAGNPQKRHARTAR
jgi:hypothetical protein